MRKAILLLLLVPSMAAVAQEDAPEEHVGPLETFRLSDLPPRELSFQLIDCSELGCNLEARLTERDQPKAALKLPWRTAGKFASREQTHTLAGVGDPLRSPEPTQVWRIGTPDMESTFDLVVREVRLGGKWRGFLVSVESGYEHLKRQYALYATDGVELVKAWSFKEPPGPGWTTTDIADLDGDGTDEVLVHEIVPGATDRSSVLVQKFDAAKKTFTAQSPKRAPKLFVVAAKAGKRDELRAVRKSEPECLGDLLVLDSASVPKLGRRRLVLGLVGTRKDLAERRRTELQNCPTPFKAQVLAAN